MVVFARIKMKTRSCEFGKRAFVNMVQGGGVLLLLFLAYFSQVSAISRIIPVHGYKVLSWLGFQGLATEGVCQDKNIGHLQQFLENDDLKEVFATDFNYY